MSSSFCGGTPNGNFSIMYWNGSCLADASALGVDTSISELQSFMPIAGIGDSIIVLVEEDLYIWDADEASWDVVPLSPQIGQDFDVGQVFEDAVYFTNYYTLCIVYNVTTQNWTVIPISSESKRVYIPCG